MLAVYADKGLHGGWDLADALRPITDSHRCPFPASPNLVRYRVWPCPLKTDRCRTRRLTGRFGRGLYHTADTLLDPHYGRLS